MGTVQLPGRLNAPSWKIETSLKSSLLTALQNSKTGTNGYSSNVNYFSSPNSIGINENEPYNRIFITYANDYSFVMRDEDHSPNNYNLRTWATDDINFIDEIDYFELIQYKKMSDYNWNYYNPSNLYLYNIDGTTTTITKEDFLQNYGDWLGLGKYSTTNPSTSYIQARQYYINSRTLVENNQLRNIVFDGIITALGNNFLYSNSSNYSVSIPALTTFAFKPYAVKSGSSSYRDMEINPFFMLNGIGYSFGLRWWMYQPEFGTDFIILKGTNTGSNNINALSSNDYSYSVVFKDYDTLNKWMKFIHQGIIPYTYSYSEAVDPNISVDDFTSGWNTYGSGQGDSGTGGGDGDGDNTSDAIGIPNLPTLGASSSGMVTLYKPELTELNSLAQYLWTPTFVEAIAKLLQDPMEGLIGLNMIPVSPTVASSKTEVKVGFVSTNVSMYKITNQFVQVDCGSLVINKYWGNYLDYNPYTKVQLFLPFIGFIDVNTDDVMGKTLNVRYYIDLMTGTCQCFVEVEGSILYTFTGNCATQIPITGSNYNAIIQASINAVAGAATGLVTGGVAGAMSSVGQDLISSASNVESLKVGVQRSGGISASGALMSYKRPYVILSRPTQSIPKDYKEFKGHPCNVTFTLSDLTGYTEVEYIHLEGFENATSDEKSAIESALMNGVIL